MANIKTSIILVTFFVVVIVFIYYLIYVHHINKAIEEGEVTGRKMIDIPRIVMGAIIVLFVLYFIIYVHGEKEAKNNLISQLDNRTTITEIDTTDYTYCGFTGTMETNDASFAKIYSKESNPGYDKDVSEQGDFTFTVFTRQSSSDAFHPDYICFVDYTGDIDELASIYQRFESIDTTDAKNYGTLESAGSNIKREYMFLGNLNKEDTISIVLGVVGNENVQKLDEAEAKYDNENNGEKPDFMDYADSTGKYTILISK